jgi:hypothetical protein
MDPKRTNAGRGAGCIIGENGELRVFEMGMTELV